MDKEFLKVSEEFLKNALECITQYVEGRFTISDLAAELAPGILAIFVLPNGFFSVFFDRHLWKPTDCMVALWGEKTLLPPAWERARIGFLPTRDERIDDHNTRDFESLMYSLGRYLISDKVTRYSEPVLRATGSPDETSWKDTCHPSCSKCGAPTNLCSEDLGSMRNHIYKCVACGDLQTMDD